MIFKSTILCLLLVIVRLQAEEPTIEFWQDKPELSSKTDIDLFYGDACELTWCLRGLPNTSTELECKVFQASTSLAIPLRNLDFALSARIEANKISTFLTHRLALPTPEKPATFLVKWRSLSQSKTTQQGSLLIRVSPHGLLAAWPGVHVFDQADLAPVKEAFIKDGNNVSVLYEIETSDWKGTLLARAKGRELEEFQKHKLKQDQCLVVFGDVKGLPSSIIVKPLGPGRIIILPLRWLSLFQKSPNIQNTIKDLVLTNH